MPAGWFFYVIPILIAVMIVACILCARRCMAPTGSCCRRAAAEETPLEALKRRYASGDVSKEQFEQMKRDLAG